MLITPRKLQPLNNVFSIDGAIVKFSSIAKYSY